MKIKIKYLMFNLAIMTLGDSAIASPYAATVQIRSRSETNSFVSKIMALNSMPLSATILSVDENAF